MDAIEQLEMLSQEQHRRYFDLFGSTPVDGGGFGDLSSYARTLSQGTNDTRAQIIGARFSTAVVASYSVATQADHLVLDATARSHGTWASITDESRRINFEGARAIDANARLEASEVGAIPDPNSPAGQAQILSRINDHQAKAAALVEQAATAEQALGARAAAAGEQGSTPRIRAVDQHTFKQDPPPPPPPKPPVEGLPPEGVRPPVEGPLTEGPASRPSAVARGGRSLYDQHGGEWRYYPGDEWQHNPHWDYKPRPGPGSDWENVPIGGLPPVSGPSIISGLPPWLLNPNAPAPPGVIGPPQNPLLAPFPGATMPAPPPASSPPPAPSLIPHISPPHIDVPPPSPAETEVAGGGLLLLLLLGAVAIA